MVWLRRLLWLAAGVLVLWGITWLAVPPLLKWQGEKRLSELLGRTVTIGKVDFSPWSLRLAIDELAVSAAPGAAPAASALPPQLSIASIRIDADARSLLRLAPVVESLQIDAPRVRLTRTGDGHYDIDDLLARLAPKPDAEPGEPQRFALYNVEVRDGEFVFYDVPVGRQQRVSGLQLSLPFISNLAAHLKVEVQPRLAFSLNGVAFDSGAQALPFSPERSGALSLKVDGLDLEPYLGYLPETLPVRVTRGRVSADLKLEFAAPATAEARVGIHGTVGVSGFEVTEADGAPLLGIGSLSLALTDVRLLARKVALGALRIEGLSANVARDAQGVLSLARFQPAAAPSQGPASSPIAASDAAASAPNATPAPANWQVTLDSLDVSGSQVVWNDAAVQPASAFVLADIGLQATRLQLPAMEPAPFTLKGTLRPQGDPAATLATLALQGEASASAATVDVDLGALSLAALAPYVSLATTARISGTGALRGRVTWAAAAGDKPHQMVATLAELGLDNLRAGTASAARNDGEIVAVKSVRLTGAEINLTETKIAITAISLQQPDLQLDRGADGAWNVARLAGATSLAEDPRADVRAAASKSWQVALKDLQVDGGRVQLNDAAAASPRAGRRTPVVRLEVDRARLAVQDVRLEGAKLVSQPKVTLAARVRAPSDDGGRDAPGTLEWRGQIGIEPLRVRGTARVEKFPVHAVQPYATHDMGLRLAHARAGFSGEVSVQPSGAAGVSVDVAGDVLLSDLMLLSVPAAARNEANVRGQELLSWQAFDLKGVKLSTRPGETPNLAIRDATLSDFFARLTLTEDGRLNLKDVTDTSDAADPAPASVAASAPRVVGAAAASAPGVSAPGPAAGRRLPVELDLGGLKLVAGRVDYSDRFVKPNFSAALTELNGSIGAYRSGSGEPAALQLGGRVAGTGLLDIAGKINPGAVPRELDIAAKATDVELAPLSPYAGKYAGYAIERGKLSMDVHYKIERDGKLTANHQVILNQLTFGERVEGPTATKLPVLFAVSLLKDADGVIDINLPVSGTLADPEFSVGGIVWKMILNLFAKVITAPFSILAGSGGKDMSIVAFQPGTAMPTADGKATIDKVAKSLAGKPALKLTVTGEADAAAERDAFEQAALEAMLVQEQRREALRASAKAPEPEAVVAIEGEERARLLKAVYKNTDLPGKPRNVIGMKSDIPAAEMEAMLRKDVKAGPDAMRELALQRGLVVRDALAAKGLATDRIFLGAPKLHDAASVAPDAGTKPDAKMAMGEPSSGASAVKDDAKGDVMGDVKGDVQGDAKAAVAWAPRAKLDLSAK